MGKEEVFQPTTFKTKMVFMTSQFIYTLLTFTVAPVVYYSKTLHLYAIGVIFIISTYFGASYYIEIFSKRYQNKFEEAKNIQKVVQIAAEAAFDSASCLTSLDVPPGAEPYQTLTVIPPSSPRNALNKEEFSKPSTPIRRGIGAGTPLSPLASSREIMRAATSAFVDEVVCDNSYELESNGSDDTYDECDGTDKNNETCDLVESKKCN